MKILVPLNNDEYLEKFINAGADELYLGFYDEEWFNMFGQYADLNRMSGFKKNANRYNFNEAIEIVKKIKDMNKKAFITLNANCYDYNQVNYIKEKYFPTMLDANIDGLIVSDIKLIKEAKLFGINVVASTMCAIYNSDIAQHYYVAGVRRMILPRDLTLSEISNICKTLNDVEYEVFFMRNGCIFSDSYCLGMHLEECGSTCGFIQHHRKQTISDYIKFNEIHDMELNDYLYNNVFHQDACALCALYQMKNIGVSCLKIVGRADVFESVCEDIVLTKKNIEIVNQSSNEQEYLKNMIFPKDVRRKCKLGYSCYYPEIRFN